MPSQTLLPQERGNLASNLDESSHCKPMDPTINIVGKYISNGMNSLIGSSIRFAIMPDQISNQCGFSALRSGSPQFEKILMPNLTLDLEVPVALHVLFHNNGARIDV